MPDLHKNTRIGLGIFGYGFIAQAHMAGLRRIPQAKVVGVCGPHRERATAFAATWDIPFVTSDPEELLRRRDVDAVIVDTPDAAHHPLVVAAAGAGKHVFCEKPLATSLARAREMVDAAHRGGVRTCMGFSNRWNDGFQYIRTLVRSGELGRIYHVHAQAFSPGLLGPRPGFSWRTDSAQSGAGILADLGAHMIDLVRFLVGDVAAVCAGLQTFVPVLYDRQTGEPREHRLDDDVALLFRLASGAQGTMALSRVGSVHADYPIGHRQLLIDGSAAGLAFENGRMLLYRGRQAIELPGDERHDGGGDHLAFLAQGAEKIMRTFLASIEQGVDLGPTLRDGLRCQEVIEAALASARAGRWVDTATSGAPA